MGNYRVESSAVRRASVVARGAGRPTIAILPFANHDDQARGYFADGVTQDIINALGRFSQLSVMSWNAVVPFRANPAKPAQVARELGVRYQVEGSVRRAADRVRVTAELVGADGRVLWSDRFEDALSDLFSMQDKIITRIAGSLAIRVTDNEQQRVFAKPTASLEAYDLVLRARPSLQRPSRASNVEARSLLRRAIELDPGFAAAYAALAETYHIDVSWGWSEAPGKTLERASELAAKALQLDESEQRAHVVLGHVHLFHNRFDQAKVEMERAIAINPSDAHALAGRGNILMWLGQTDEAIASLELAEQLDPEINADDRFALAMAHYLKRHYESAIGQAELNLRNSQSSKFSYVVLGACYGQQARAAEAARVLAELRRLDPTFEPDAFGSKFRNPDDLEHLRAGLRLAGFYGSRQPNLPTAK